MNETLEDLFLRIENIIGAVETVDEVKETKMEYFKEHRFILEYFNYVQAEIEEGR